MCFCNSFFFFFFQAEDGIRDKLVTGVQTCALPICRPIPPASRILARAQPGPDARSVSPRGVPAVIRSEERRVGKEGRSRWSPYHEKKKTKRKYYIHESYMSVRRHRLKIRGGCGIAQ